MILHALREWWARVQLIGLLRFGNANCYYASELHYPECASNTQAARCCLEPYQAMAEFWHDYNDSHQWDYSAFLIGLSKAEQIQLHSVLDLACGTGAQAMRLAKHIPNVVGLDISEPMLEQARARSVFFEGIRYVLHDFRNFQLDQAFDAIVCASNSLNYVRSMDELAQVFRCAAAHLRANGVFTFDTVTQMGMQLLSGQYFHVSLPDSRFAIHFDYDQQKKLETSTGLMPTGSEIHYRIPIDSQDVRIACQGTGLVVQSDFSTFLMPGWMYTGPIRFFVLKKT